jgi:hypothetical protein
MAISPKKSPGPRAPISAPFTVTAALPWARTKKSYPDAPSPTRRQFSPTSFASNQQAISVRSASLADAKSGTTASSDGVASMEAPTYPAPERCSVCVTGPSPLFNQVDSATAALRSARRRTAAPGGDGS